MIHCYHVTCEVIVRPEVSPEKAPQAVLDWLGVAARFMEGDIGRKIAWHRTSPLRGEVRFEAADRDDADQSFERFRQVVAKFAPGMSIVSIAAPREDGDWPAPW